MSRKKKERVFTPIECPCCRNVIYRELHMKKDFTLRLKLKPFLRKIHHPDVEFVRMTGLLCDCGYVISKQGIYFRYDLENIIK